MRQDMAKVVTEAPRRGSSFPSKKTSWRLRPQEFFLDDHGPNRHPVSRRRQYGYNYREFSDVLGPLRRFLRKQVGRRWDGVHSELSRSLDKRSLAGLHIWDHVKWEVETNCWLGADNKVYTKPRFGSRNEVSGLYVHPSTGLLCYKQPARYRWGHWAHRQSAIKRLLPYGFAKDELEKRDRWKNFAVVDELTILEKINNLWFVHTFARLDPEEVVETKSVGDREIRIRRKDKPWPLKYRLNSRQIGRKDKQFRRFINRDSTKNRGFLFAVDIEQIL